MKSDYTDYHCHILPTLDDGAVDLQESLAVARVLAEFGFRTVYCTPHRIKGCFENPPDRVRGATEALQRNLDGAGIPLRLLPGTEHYMDEFLLDEISGAPLTASRYLLLEVPFKGGSELLPSVVAGLLGRGISPLFAHPERCDAFEPALRSAGGMRGAFSSLLGMPKAPEIQEGSLILTLRNRGCRFQGNLGSFAGLYGREVKQRALLFLRHGLYSCLGSDAHRSDHLATMLAAGYRAVAAEIGNEGASALLSAAEL